jgi:hypothetical protein
MARFGRRLQGGVECLIAPEKVQTAARRGRSGKDLFILQRATRGSAVGFPQLLCRRSAVGKFLGDLHRPAASRLRDSLPDSAAARASEETQRMVKFVLLVARRPTVRRYFNVSPMLVQAQMSQHFVRFDAHEPFCLGHCCSSPCKRS